MKLVPGSSSALWKNLRNTFGKLVLVPVLVLVLVLCCAVLFCAVREGRRRPAGG